MEPGFCQGISGAEFREFTDSGFSGQQKVKARWLVFWELGRSVGLGLLEMVSGGGGTKRALQGVH